MCEEKNKKFAFKIILISVFYLFLFIGLIYGIKATGPWWSKVTGKSELAQAEQNRQIAILEAQAKLDSAKKLAEAEIERAKGIAEANRIISGSITNEYLKYKFIEGLNDGNTEVIYIPTEANLPILEATKNIQE
ncbi:MAG: hypothetical protein ACFFG0_03235 [Candidatus Thorarchaeota archaeon]